MHLFHYEICNAKTEEIKALLYKDSHDNSTRKRSHGLLLNYQKRTITDPSKVFGLSCITIERWLNDWAVGEVDSLPIFTRARCKNPFKRV